MYINPQPRKFNVRFKPEELMIVKSAIIMHINNPGTPKSRVKVGEVMLKRLDACGTSEEYTTSKIEFILFGLGLMKSEQHKELIEKTILSLSNGIKPSTSYSIKPEKTVVDKEPIFMKSQKDWEIGDKVVCCNTVGLSSIFREVELRKEYTINYIAHNVQQEKLIWLKEIGITGALHANRFHYSPNQTK